MSLQVIVVALALVLIIEGIGPLFFTHKWQSYLFDLSKQNPEILRRLAGCMVTVGIVLMIIFL